MSDYYKNYLVKVKLFSVEYTADEYFKTDSKTEKITFNAVKRDYAKVKGLTIKCEEINKETIKSLNLEENTTKGFEQYIKDAVDEAFVLCHAMYLDSMTQEELEAHYEKEDRKVLAEIEQREYEKSLRENDGFKTLPDTFSFDDYEEYLTSLNNNSDN